jgi:hypothetical protein
MSEPLFNDDESRALRDDIHQALSRFIARRLAKALFETPQGKAFLAQIMSKQQVRQLHGAMTEWHDVKARNQLRNGRQ